MSHLSGDAFDRWFECAGTTIEQDSPGSNPLSTPSLTDKPKPPPPRPKDLREDDIELDPSGASGS